MNTISREYWFSAAHRIEGHPKCGRLHGHNYKVVVYITGTLNESGMVLDYGDMDRILKPAIDVMDHRYIVSENNIRHGDPYFDAAVATGRVNDLYSIDAETSTAEELARVIHRIVCNTLRWSVNKVKIMVQETPKSEAWYEG